MSDGGRAHGRWAFFWALGQFGVQAFAALFSFFLVARAVGPAAYADYVVGLAIVGVAQCFGLAIFREPVVQTADVNALQLASAAKVSALWSLLVAVFTSLAAWAWFAYSGGSRAVLEIVCLLSLRLFLDGIVAVPLAGKARTLDLRLQAVSSMIGSLVLIAVVMVMVNTGVGIVGLAIGQVAGQLVQSCISLYFANFQWHLAARIDRAFLRELLPKSASVVSWQVIDYINGSLDRLFVSARMQSAQIGVYGFGKRLNDIIFETVGGGLGMVCLPVFARASADLQLLKGRFLGWIGCSAFFVLPLLSFLFVCADALVQAVFGDKWLGSVPIYRVFLILGVIQALGVVQAALIRGMGRAGIWTRYLSLQAVGNVGVVFFFSGVSAFALAVAIVVKTYLVWGYSVALICKLLEIRYTDYVRSIARTFAIAAGSGMLVWLGCRSLGLSGMWFVAASAVLYVLIYACASYLLNKSNAMRSFGVVRGRFS